MDILADRLSDKIAELGLDALCFGASNRVSLLWEQARRHEAAFFDKLGETYKDFTQLVRWERAIRGLCHEYGLDDGKGAFPERDFLRSYVRLRTTIDYLFPMSLPTKPPATQVSIAELSECHVEQITSAYSNLDTLRRVLASESSRIEGVLGEDKAVHEMQAVIAHLSA
jgi:hypothetical protein